MIENSEINDRVIELMATEKLNQSTFSKALGLKGTTSINKIVQAKITVSAAICIKIHDAFNVNLNWLLVGKGEMYLDLKKVEDLESDLSEERKKINTLMQTLENINKLMGEK